jgi:hypothetical protein
MRVVTNQKLIDRNKKIAQYLVFGSLGLLALSFFLNTRQLSPENETDVLLGALLPLLIIPLTFVLMLMAVRLTNLWVRPPRPEDVIRDGLKGISNNAVLYNYYHAPAQHVLISPQGVFAIVNRFQSGVVSVENDKWVVRKSFLQHFLSLMRMDGIGNPSQDALRAAESVQSTLRSIATDLKVQPIVVFHAPDVSLSVESASVPVLYASSKIEKARTLKAYLQTLPRSATLTPEQLSKFEKATTI